MWFCQWNKKSRLRRVSGKNEGKSIGVCNEIIESVRADRGNEKWLIWEVIKFSLKETKRRKMIFNVYLEKKKLIHVELFFNKTLDWFSNWF